MLNNRCQGKICFGLSLALEVPRDSNTIIIRQYIGNNLCSEVFHMYEVVFFEGSCALY